MTRVLVLNSGSSGLKWTLLDKGGTTLAGESIPWSSDEDCSKTDQIEAALRDAPAFDVVGHRVVHGGGRFSAACLIDDSIRDELGRLGLLDPEHMQPALAGIDAVRANRPDVPQVACFDTAFHATLPEAAAGYALPFEWTERWGLRRHGFHGLSVEYAVSRVTQLHGEVPPRMIVCHLGGGCSLTALERGRSIDTTMGGPRKGSNVHRIGV